METRSYWRLTRSAGNQTEIAQLERAMGKDLDGPHGPWSTIWNKRFAIATWQTHKTGKSSTLLILHTLYGHMCT